MEAAKARQKRIKEQEAEIAELKRQLAGAPRNFGGRAGGRNLDAGVPAEYLCPITQVHFPSLTSTQHVMCRSKWLRMLLCSNQRGLAGLAECRLTSAMFAV